VARSSLCEKARGPGRSAPYLSWRCAAIRLRPAPSDGFYRECDLRWRTSRDVHGITLVVGHPHQEGGSAQRASVLRDGQIVGRTTITLPNYTVFDEERIRAGERPCVFRSGRPVRPEHCEDLGPWALT